MLSIIVAIDEKRGIGKGGKIPWHIPEDLKHFREITTGHPVIMGRKTFESIGHPLPNRTNIVITRDSDYKAEGTIVVHSLEEGMEKAKNPEVSIGVHLGGVPDMAPRENEIFIIGGGQIYAQAIDKADKLYLTIVEGEYDADTFFPDYSAFKKVINKESHESAGYKYTFLELER